MHRLLRSPVSSAVRRSSDVVVVEDAAEVALRKKTVSRAMQAAAEAEAKVATYKGNGPTPKVEDPNALAVEEPKSAGVFSSVHTMKAAAFTEEERKLRLVGQKASQVAKWYEESRQKPDSSLGIVIRTKLGMSGAEYLEDKERTKTAEIGWAAFNAAFIMLAAYALFQFRHGDQRFRFFCEFQEDALRLLEEQEEEDSEENMMAMQLSKYGWYLKWKDARATHEKEAELVNLGRSYAGSTHIALNWNMRRRAIPMRHNADWFTSFFGYSIYS